MSCGGCSGKNCCSNAEKATSSTQIKHDSLFITFTVFPKNTYITFFTLSK